MMRCRTDDCEGEYEHRTITRSERHGGQVVVFDEVEVEVCTVCGDIVYPPETAERLESLRDAVAAGTAHPSGSAPVYRLSASPNAPTEGG